MTTEPGESLRQRDLFVNTLAQSLSDGSALANVPSLIKKVVRERMWQERYVNQTKQVIKFKTFSEFLEAYPPEGLHTSLDVLMKICKSYEDMEAIDLLAQESAGKKGGQTENQNAAKTNVNNVNVRSEKEKRPMGNSTAATMRRLAKDFPDVHARVLSGELSPHAAAKAAGFRKANLQMPADPIAAGLYLAKHVDEEWLMTCYETFVKARGATHGHE